MCAFRTYDKLVFSLRGREGKGYYVCFSPLMTNWYSFWNGGRRRDRVCGFHGLQTSLVQEDKTQKFRNGDEILIRKS